jgi:hypothetical protein
VARRSLLSVTVSAKRAPSADDRLYIARRSRGFASTKKTAALIPMLREDDLLIIKPHAAISYLQSAQIRV